MSGGLVDDYLSQLLGGATAPAPVADAATPPAPAPAPIARAPASPDEIGEDEFEALLDALHGDAPPGAAAPTKAPAPPAPIARAPASPDEISEDEFEALLDALHGDAPPGAIEPVVAAPPKAMPPKAAPAAGKAADEISDDEFEALLDTLHGGQPPGSVGAAAAVAVAAARATRTAGPDAPPPPEDGDDEGDRWHGEERRASRRASRWLRLRVHQQDYAVELLKVQEVLLPVPILAMRDTDPAILGVMNLRGVVVPVLDLGLWLGLEEVPDSPQTRFAVLEQNGECLALKVTAVLDVHALADNEIEPAEHTLAEPSAAMLRGVTRLNSQPVILLDAAGLLG